MRIGGIQRFSLIDYPGKLSAVIFTQGCPFRCHYCHNPSLVLPSLFDSSYKEEDIFSFLFKRKDQLDAIVITGGEPTQQKDLLFFLDKIKKLGYLVKLDTNGTNPQMVKELIEKNLVDYIAMDIKAPIEKYENIIGTKTDVSSILESINLLFLSSSIEYEFRTTIVPSFFQKEDILSICHMIEKAPLFILQNFVAKNTLNPLFLKEKSFSLKEMEMFQKLARKFVKKCLIR